MKYDPNKEAKRFDSIVDNYILFSNNQLPLNPFEVIPEITPRQQNLAFTASKILGMKRELERTLAQDEFQRQEPILQDRQRINSLQNSYQSLRNQFVEEEAKKYNFDFSKVS